VKRVATAILGLVWLYPHAAVQAQSMASLALVGTWTWTRTANGCVETHEYRADGSRFVVSGEERSESRYSVSGPTPSGFMKLAVTTLRDHGGKDCGGDASDDSGHTWSVFFRIDQPAQAVLFCYEEALTNCYGPFRRVK
jgi:hypothetical protein